MQRKQNKTKQNKKKSSKMNGGSRANNNNGLSKMGAWRTMSRFAAGVSIGATSTFFRIDVIPTLSIFPL